MFSVHKLIAEDDALDKMMRANPDTLAWLTDINTPDIEVAELEPVAIDEPYQSPDDDEQDDTEPLSSPVPDEPTPPDLNDSELEPIEEIASIVVDPLEVFPPEVDQGIGDTLDDLGEIDLIHQQDQLEDIHEVEINTDESVLQDAPDIELQTYELIPPEEIPNAVSDLEEMASPDVDQDAEIPALAEPDGIGGGYGIVDESVVEPAERAGIPDNSSESDEIPVTNVTSGDLYDGEIEQPSSFEPDSLPEPEFDVPEYEAVQQPKTPPGVDSEPLPDIAFELPIFDAAEPPAIEPVGFQGLYDLGDVTERQLAMEEMTDPSLEYSERSERQIEFQMRSNEDLAERLAFELGPKFDDMNDHTTMTVHDYVDGQALLTALLRPREFM